MTVINPFDFFLEEVAESFPFEYQPALRRDLRPYLEIAEQGPRLMSLVGQVDKRRQRTIDFLVTLNQQLEQKIDYVIRLEPGVQNGRRNTHPGTGVLSR